MRSFLSYVPSLSSTSTRMRPSQIRSRKFHEARLSFKRISSTCRTSTFRRIHRLISRFIPVTRAGHIRGPPRICETKTIDSRLQLFEKKRDGCNWVRRVRWRRQIRHDESISLVCTPRRAPPVKVDTSITFDRFRKIYVYHRQQFYAPYLTGVRSDFCFVVTAESSR